MHINGSNEVKARSRLKGAILSELAASNSSMHISPDVIDLRLQQFFPTFHTPVHPPYSSMIQEAILKLNEEDGSSKEAISSFLEKEHEDLPWGNSSFLDHHLKKLCRNGEIVCVNNELYMLQADNGDSRNEEEEEEEMSHRLNIAKRDGKEDKTLVQGKGREVKAIDGLSGINRDQAEESEDRCEIERWSVKVNGQTKACQQSIKGLEEQKEGRQELNKEVQEESQNFSGRIEAVEEVDEAKGKPAKVAQKRRGKRRKQPEKTERQIKVLKDDIPQPMIEEAKKYVEELQQQITDGSGVMKSIVLMNGEKEQSQQGKVISQQGHPQDQKIDIRTKMIVFPCDGEDRENLKTPLQECSVHILEEEKDLAKNEEEKKEDLEHEGQQQRTPNHKDRDSMIVCALPAQQQPQLRTNFYQKAHKLHKDSISTSLESRESGDILLKQLKLYSRRRCAELLVTTSERFIRSKRKPAKFYTRREIQNSRSKVKTSLGTSKDLQETEKKQGQEFRKAEKLLEFEIKTSGANFSSEEAAVSLSNEVKDSMNDPLELGQYRREPQKMHLKVYARRKVSKSQLKETETFNNNLRIA
ncbi:hypothetical protein DITRI_Ditri17bG0089100 [Diplodiscus trichospermus]